MARNECDYCEVDDIKTDMGEQWTSGVKYDRTLEWAIAHASRLIDAELGWRDCHYSAADLAIVTWYYDTESGDEMQIDRFLDDVGFAVAVDETATGAYVVWVRNTDYIIWPDHEGYINRVLIKTGASKVFPTGQRLLEIKGRPGAHSTPPDVIRRACMITVIRWFKRAMQGYQDTGAIVELAQLRYTKALDPDVVEILSVTPRRANWG